ncbi:MAG: hypothetical protein GYB68_14495 [Chloroflexi bacterium]|nr:hypothetical protein [Chloroflexota bacterium]
MCIRDRGYPIRIDFPAQENAGSNWLIVGEAAGLVNPTTGEGIDLAIESGLMAAEVLHDDIEKGRPHHRRYAQRLAWRYAPLFTALRLSRLIFMNPLMLDYLIWLMTQHKLVNRTVARLAQGTGSPLMLFNPLFLAELLIPVAPKTALKVLSPR